MTVSSLRIRQLTPHPVPKQEQVQNGFKKNVFDLPDYLFEFQSIFFFFFVCLSLKLIVSIQYVKMFQKVYLLCWN